MRKYIEVPARVFGGIILMLAALVGTHMYDVATRTYVPATVLVEKAIKSVVVVECYTPAKKKGEFNVSTTAGFVASDYGHIITVAHGLTECTGKNQKNLRIRFWEDPSIAYRAAILRMDEAQDAAILQVPLIPKEVKPLGIDLSIQKQGRRAIAIGHPGLFYWSVSDGLVSADRIWTGPYRHLLQVSIPIVPGNSGGPILNEDGLVIGVASFYVDDSPTLGFLIPMETMVRLAHGLYF